MLIDLLNDLKRQKINVLGLAPEDYEFKKNSYNYYKILIITDEGVFSEFTYFSEKDRNIELNKALELFEIEEL